MRNTHPPNNAPRYSCYGVRTRIGTIMTDSSRPDHKFTFMCATTAAKSEEDVFCILYHFPCARRDVSHRYESLYRVRLAAVGLHIHKDSYLILELGVHGAHQL